VRFSAFGREIIRPKSNSFFSISKSVLAAVLDFVKLEPAGTAEKSYIFEPPSHHRKSSETKSLTFLLQPIFHLAERFNEDWLY